MLNNTLVIGFGHRARNGKDFCASHLQKQYNDLDIKIYHWADALYKEVQNERREHPLIIYDGTHFMLKDKYDENNRPIYQIFNQEMLPELQKIWKERKYKREYRGANEKDAPMLQVWGTNYRRNHCNPNYWVERTFESIAKNESDELHIAFIPDTRFHNELNAIIDEGGSYIKVTRLNPDGSQFLDTSRDPDHPSESQLEGITKDYEIVAESGQVGDMYRQAVEIFEKILNKYKAQNEAT